MPKRMPSDDEIFKVDTVPPPAGEDDPYNSPTRVGPMESSVVDEMIHASERKASELAALAKVKQSDHKNKVASSAEAPSSGLAPERAFPAPPRPYIPRPHVSRPAAPTPTPPMRTVSPAKPSSSTPPSSVGFPSATAPHALGVFSSPPDEGVPPRLYDDDDDEAATLLGRGARAPLAIPQPEDPSAVLDTLSPPSSTRIVTPPTAPELEAADPASGMLSTLHELLGSPRRPSIGTILALAAGLLIFATGAGLYLYMR